MNLQKSERVLELIHNTKTELEMMKQLKFAVIGLKTHGKRHIEGIIANNTATLAAICDNDAEILSETAKIYGIKNTVLDYHELLDKTKIDAVCIVTPDQVHREMVVDFLEAGIDVLCEKPLALNLEDCAAMLEAEKVSGAKLMVGQVCRKTPGFIKAKEIVDSGLIGELFFVESEYAHDYSYMPLHWRNDKEKPRHPVAGGGCHPVDLLRWIAGDPIEAYAYSNKKSLNDDWPCDDSAVAVLKFPNKLMGKVYISTGCKRNYTMRTVLYGTKGTVITDNTSPTLTLYLSEFEGRSEFLGSAMENIGLSIPIDINNHNVGAEIDDFIDILLGKKENEIPGCEGAATVAVCEAIIASAESGNPQTVKYLN